MGKPWAIPYGARMGFKRGCPCPDWPQCARGAPYKSRTGSGRECYLGGNPVRPVLAAGLATVFSPYESHLGPVRDLTGLALAFMHESRLGLEQARYVGAPTRTLVCIADRSFLGNGMDVSNADYQDP